MSLAGVYTTALKDGTPSYRAGFTYSGKHISLGSFPTEEAAHLAYCEAAELLSGSEAVTDYHKKKRILSFAKYVSLLNLRDHDIYFRTPIYLGHRCFYYYLDCDTFLTFDLDDLFFYSTHTIMQRGGHLFAADYGMQINILSRYGIREHAVLSRDYEFMNGNPYDLRYDNIRIINRYYGVTKIQRKGKDCFRAKIHLRGDFIIGDYDSEEKAAIAYNKAADIVKRNGCKKNFRENYPDNISNKEYADIYQEVVISPKILKVTF